MEEFRSGRAALTAATFLALMFAADAIERFIAHKHAKRNIGRSTRLLAKKQGRRPPRKLVRRQETARQCACPARQREAPTMPSGQRRYLRPRSGQCRRRSRQGPWVAGWRRRGPQQYEARSQWACTSQASQAPSFEPDASPRRQVFVVDDWSTKLCQGRSARSTAPQEAGMLQQVRPGVAIVLSRKAVERR